LSDATDWASSLDTRRELVTTPLLLALSDSAPQRDCSRVARALSSADLYDEWMGADSVRATAVAFAQVRLHHV
jgi:hypothetical protein